MRNAIWRTILSIPGVQAVKWRSLRPAVFCFNYHRIGDPGRCPFDRDVYSCTAERFEQHVRYLQKHFDLVRPECLGRCLSENRGRRQRFALITFDDGYRDNYELAFPILRRLGAPATFFLPTAFIGTDRVPWWDEVAWALRHARRTRVRLSGWDEWLPLGPAEVDRSIRMALRWIKACPPARLGEQLAELRNACAVSGMPGPADVPLFLTWEQAREMHAAGMSIGSHTHTHPILAHLEPDAQEEEMRLSRKILETQLQAPVVAIAYPDGQRWTYNRATLEAARRAGYEVGFNYANEVNRLPLPDLLEVGRLPVAGDPSPDRLRSVACFPQHFG